MHWRLSDSNCPSPTERDDWPKEKLLVSHLTPSNLTAA